MLILTYDDLCAVFPGKKGTLDPNIRSAINRYREWRQCSQNDQLGDEWNSDSDKWERLLKEFLSGLVGKIKPGSISNLGSVLSKARQHMIDLAGSPFSGDSLTEAATRAQFATRVTAARKAAGLSQRQVAKRLGMSRENYVCWEKGRIPRNHARLQAIEKALEVAPGALGIDVYVRNVAFVANSSILAGKFGQACSTRKKNENFKYRVTVEEIKNQNPLLWRYIQSWIAHKTDEVPRPGRDRGKPWSTAFKKIAMNTIRSFFGFLTKQGQPLITTHLLDLANPDKIWEFLQFMKARTGNYVTPVDNIRGIFAPALFPERGFFSACWELFVDDPVARSRCGFKEVDCGAQADGRKEFKVAFNAFCAEKRKAILLMAKQALDNEEGHMSRDPEESINVILSARRPIDYLFRLVDCLKADRLYRSGATPELLACQARDIAMIELMIRIPLRARTFVRWLSWNEGNTGTFRQERDGRWCVDLPPEAFKNIRGAAKGRRYKVYVPESVAQLILNYLKNWRHLHITEEFIALANDDIRKNEPRHRVDPPAPCDRLFGYATAEALSQRLSNLSARYLGIRFRAHAFRHIVATAYLKKFPEAYVRLAHLLNDTLKTVLKVYAHKDEAESLRPFHEFIDRERITKSE